METVNTTVEPERGKMKSAMTESAHSESGSIHGTRPGVGAVPKDRERKIGHRRVDEKTGTVTYKKKSTSELMRAIQLGIGQSVGGLSSKPERDLLMQDFGVVQSVVFPSEGSNMTPAHHCSDFRFKTYAPLAFRFFRELFNIRPDDFMLSLCDEAMNELSNPGAGGSIFYISADDEFIIKTAQHKEAGFLQKLLPGYYMNLNQNPRTLLPKFYGLFCYQLYFSLHGASPKQVILAWGDGRFESRDLIQRICGGKNIRFVVMNNILPSTVKMHEKYDLKGSTYKRKASKSERLKSSPTLKDLDFMDIHPEGLLLEKETYDALIKTIQRDCRVLESFKIMDYSLLMGIHNLDQAKRDRAASQSSGAGTSGGEVTTTTTSHDMGVEIGEVALARGKSVRTKVTQYSTPMESIQVEAPDRLEEFEDEDIPPGGIPAKNAKGERLYLYLGVIDILQCYRFRKKFEHTFKSMIADGDTVSVTRPSFYSERFQKFFMSTVFRKAPSPLKHSPSKRKPGERGPRTTSMSASDDPNIDDPNKDQLYHLSPDNFYKGKTGARPDLLIDSSTPPPTFDEALASKSQSRDGRASVSPKPGMRTVDSDRSDRPFFQTIQQQESNVRVRHSPISVTESTPTYTDFTEGTPSYTPSSPSCCSDVLDNNIPNLPLEQGSAISLAQDSVTGSPSRLMAGSISTEASYHSAVSHMEVSTSERHGNQVVTVTRTDDNTVKSSVSGVSSNSRTVSVVNSDRSEVKNSRREGEVILTEPRISVVSQASSATSSCATSTNDGAYTESSLSSSSDQSESTVKMDSSIKNGIVVEDTESPPGGELIPDEDASTHL